MAEQTAIMQPEQKRYSEDDLCRIADQLAAADGNEEITQKELKAALTYFKKAITKIFSSSDLATLELSGLMILKEGIRSGGVATPPPTASNPNPEPVEYDDYHVVTIATLGAFKDAINGKTQKTQQTNKTQKTTTKKS